MTIWMRDSLSAPGSCKGARDYKLHYQNEGWAKRRGCVTKAMHRGEMRRRRCARMVGPV